MSKFLKVWLAILFFSSIQVETLGFLTHPLTSLVLLLIKVLIFVGLWKGAILVSDNPENQTNNRWIHILRWFLLIVSSTLAVQLGILVIFIVRFFIDQSMSDGNVWVIQMVESLGPMYANVLIVLGLLLSIFPLTLMGKALKFSRPWSAASLVALIWAILMWASQKLLIID